jgi:hypothetical protein
VASCPRVARCISCPGATVEPDWAMASLDCARAYPEKAWIATSEMHNKVFFIIVL